MQDLWCGAADAPPAESCRYGPFWIATTLVFVTAVTGNYASYVSYHRAHAGAGGSEEQAWYYDIDKVLHPPTVLLVPGPQVRVLGRLREEEDHRPAWGLARGAAGSCPGITGCRTGAHTQRVHAAASALG